MRRSSIHAVIVSIQSGRARGIRIEQRDEIRPAPVSARDAGVNGVCEARVLRRATIVTVGYLARSRSIEPSVEALSTTTTSHGSV